MPLVGKSKGQVLGKWNDEVLKKNWKSYRIGENEIEQIEIQVL